MEQEGFDLAPDYIKNWKQSEVLWVPGEIYENEEACFNYVLDDNTRIPLAGHGELVVFMGKEKSRKSLLLQCVLLAAYSSMKKLSMGYELELSGPILHFDTEQSKQRCYKNRRRFHFLSGQKDNDPYYRTFSIKDLSSAQMIEFITHTIEAVSLEMGVPPSIIAIDQIADLMPGRDVNDPLGADNIINYMNIWTKSTGALMMVVIHTNRGGQESNGVLGSMLDKKTDCSFHVSMDQDTWISTVTHKHSKDARIPKFTFHQDEHGNPEFLKSLGKGYDL